MIDSFIMDDVKMEEKLTRLYMIIDKIGSAVVAFSGGVDSTFLLKVAKDRLGSKVMALTATSPTYPTYELEDAQRFARMLGVRHSVVESNELGIPEFTKNSPRRCYYCKKELFRICKERACEEGFDYVLDGSNLDDLNDFRPGMEAAEELGVRSPLREAGLTKDEIRYLSKKMGLESWNKPPFACLSSRFPYGIEITKEKLDTVAEGERFLRKMGFSQFRVRYHQEMVRIELGEDEMGKALKLRQQLIPKFKELGFIYITLDLEGYRSGSMNALLKSRPE